MAQLQKQTMIYYAMSLLKAVRSRNDVAVKQLLKKWHEAIEAKQDARIGMKTLEYLVHHLMTDQEVAYMRGLY